GEAGGPESAEAALSGEAGGPESAADFWPAVGAADSPADADAAPPAPAALEQEGGADAGESAAQSDPLPDPERARAEAEAPGAAETPPLVFSDPLVPLAFQIIEPTEHVAFSAVPAAGVPVPDPAAAASLSEATVRRRTAPNLAPFGDSEDDDLGAQGVLEDWSLVS
ncbi:MAG TPA: hypothetical protein VNI01_10185, partial [Elusimicrobiota bacterium]|nr:hypothetical protein [Elusimicrobiota bacterium]